ncbi:hypothetical protein ACVMIH_007525 [Bradyrhizobium sp. USDA 4503]
MSLLRIGPAVEARRKRDLDAGGDRGAGRRLRAGGEGEPTRSAGRRQAAIAAAARKAKKPVTTADADHGRKEKRSALVVPVKDMEKTDNFPGLKAVAQILGKRGKDKAVPASARSTAVADS